jgi:hypothetical protein
MTDREIRRLANASRNNLAVRIVPGCRSPKEVGHGWYYMTLGGRVINHPSAYAKRGWSNMTYVSATRRIEVGAAWLRAQAEAVRIATIACVRLAMCESEENP